MDRVAHSPWRRVRRHFDLVFSVLSAGALTIMRNPASYDGLLCLPILAIPGMALIDLVMWALTHFGLI